MEKMRQVLVLALSKLGAEIGSLVATKQAAYGDSFGKSGKVVQILYPHGIASEQIDDSLTIVRMIDKLFRIATDKDALGEDPYRDVLGYSVLSIRRLRMERAENGEAQDYVALGTEIGAQVFLSPKLPTGCYTETSSVMKVLYPNGINGGTLLDKVTVKDIVSELLCIATNQEDRESAYRVIANLCLKAIHRRQDHAEMIDRKAA